MLAPRTEGVAAEESYVLESMLDAVVLADGSGTITCTCGEARVCACEDVSVRER